VKSILEIYGESPAVLMPVFGQKSHVSDALNGKRPAGAGDARSLGRPFRTQPRNFI